jgi:hypothetical protein
VNAEARFQSLNQNLMVVEVMDELGTSIYLLTWIWLIEYRPARKSTRRRHRHHHDHDHDHGADGHGCADHAAKPNKYDVQPRGVPKVLPTT